MTKLNKINMNYERYNKMHKKEELEGRHFKEPGFYIRDHCFITKNGEYHLFYIRGKNEKSFSLQKDLNVGHASTFDFKYWKIHRPINVCGSPYVIEFHKKFYMFTPCVSDLPVKERSIVLHWSEDLFNWEPYLKTKIIHYPSSKFYLHDIGKEKGTHYRDFHIIKYKRKFVMFYTAMTKKHLGCVAAAISSDLLKWRDIGPILAVDKSFLGLSQWDTLGYGVPESPFVLKRGNYWHLFITDNSVPQVCHFWSKRLFSDWNFKNGHKLFVAPNGYQVPMAATEIIKTKDGEFLSYYYYDLEEHTNILKLEKIIWDGKIPLIVW